MVEPAVIAQMLRRDQIERVAVNPEHAREVLEMARAHVRTAQLLAQTEDRAMAFTAAYDASRKALTAVLAAQGLRVRPKGGAHVNTGLAARAYVEDPALEDFEWMRQIRNSTEYPDQGRPTAQAQDVAEAIQAADAIVRACTEHLAR